LALNPGTRLGPYEITALLGVGGMGEVYRATDTNLKRQVAIKVLPASVAGVTERLTRFQREAEILAVLNHPNIAHIHGLEKSDGTIALVMELVEGPTLSDRIAQGAISISDALPIAKQIADALEAAHEQGIIHRDLKPANIKVRPDGTAKILDFGLAKALDPSAAMPSSVSMSPTITSPAMTQAGIILGTAAYMSPEQAKGRAVDKRSDIWAFGCVLFEMLTGARPFRASRTAQAGSSPAIPGEEVETIAETLASVIMKDPDWSLLPRQTPPAIHRLLRRCLEKDRRKRLESAADARLELDDALNNPATSVGVGPSVVPAMRPARRRAWLGLNAAAVLVAAAIASVSTWVMFRPLPARIARLTVLPAEGVRPGDPFALPDVAITPDGSRIVYTSGTVRQNQQLFVRSLDQLESVGIKGLNAPFSPFLSPDGTWIAYFEDAGLKKVPITGGPAISICTFAAAGIGGGSWGDDGTIVYSLIGAGAGLYRVRAEGGTPEVLIKPDPSKQESAFLWPEFLPGSKVVLFGITAGVRTPSRIAAFDLTTKVVTPIVEAAGAPHYVSSGHLVYAVDGVVRAVAFDRERLAVHGTPVGFVDHVATKVGGLSAGAGSFAVSRNGTLVYRTGDLEGGPSRTLVWVDRSGREEPVGVPNRTYVYARLSPDASKIALDIRGQQSDIWVWDVLRPGLTRLMSDPGIHRGAVWSPDGRRVAFEMERDGQENIYWQLADGSGVPEPLTDGPIAKYPTSFTVDRLLFAEPASPPYDLWSLDLKSKRADVLLHGPQSESNAEVSPDGHWLAYESDESKRPEVYIRPFPKIDTGRWMVSTEGGSRPAWLKNGRELYYQMGPTADGVTKIMAVSVETGTTPRLGIPHPVVEGPYGSPQGGRSYDVTADGKRFLMIKAVEPPRSTAASAQSQLMVVLNWNEELKQRVPTK
jgi:serine/threonine-protein kinase